MCLHCGNFFGVKFVSKRYRLLTTKIDFIKEHIMKRSIIAAAVFFLLFFMSAGVFAADVDTGTLTIKGILQNLRVNSKRVAIQ